MTDTQLANRIISAVYRKDGGKALDRIEEELDASLSLLLDHLAANFDDAGNTRMANRCLRAFNDLTGCD